MIREGILIGLREAYFSQIKEMHKITIISTIAPNAIDRKNQRVNRLEKEEDSCIDQIILSQSQFLDEFKAVVKGDWVDVAKEEFEAVKNSLEAIK